MENPADELPALPPTVSEILLLLKPPSAIRHRTDDSDLQPVRSHPEPPLLKEGVLPAVLSPVPSTVTLVLPVVATFLIPKALEDWRAIDHA